MRRFIGVMRGAWREDLLGRETWRNSGNLWLYAAALFLPFGWVFLLLRLEPVRLAVRSLRQL
ncbi:MAG: hypothetical protein HY725_03850 [Candidatus Rokubacteria bacterium]|nr:hypothetical protein [Candidatus Rokubacteria bacterium]